MLIKRLGGIEAVNEKLIDLGLLNTKLNNLLPDLEGTNKTTTKDLAISIGLIDSGMLLSPRSRDLFREIMSESKSNNLLPKAILEGIGGSAQNIDYGLLIKGYKVYNKTGDIGITYADAGLIQMPDNTRAVAAFIVQGPFNDRRLPELIRQLASEAIKEIKPSSEL